jgi:hypothetical protein
MACEVLPIPGGGAAIVCSRGQRPAGPCSVCGVRRHTKLCDGPPPPKSRRKTCDAKLCDACALKVADVLPTGPAEVRGFYRDHTTREEVARELERRHPRELDTRDLCPACVGVLMSTEREGRGETFREWYCAKPAEERRKFWEGVARTAPKGWPPTWEAMEAEQFAAGRIGPRRRPPAAPPVQVPPTSGHAARPEPPESCVSEKTTIRVLIVEGELDTSSALVLIRELTERGIARADVPLPAGVTGQAVTASVPAKPAPAPVRDEAAPEPAPEKPAAPTRQRAKPPPPAPAAATPEAPATPPPPPPAPAPAPAPKAAPAPAAGQLTEAQVLEVAGAKKLADVLRFLQKVGITTVEAMVAECTRIRSAVPILGRVPEDALKERVEYTLEGLA